jgi:hypothetical protein
MEGRRHVDRNAGSPLYRRAPPVRLRPFQARLVASLVVLEESARHHRAFGAGKPIRRRTPRGDLSDPEGPAYPTATVALGIRFTGRTQRYLVYR